MVKVSVPDDAPPVLATSHAYAELKAHAEVVYHDTLPGSEATLIERLGDAGVAINIRSSSKFTARVFASCPRLRLLSLWGTGTDNVDLAAAAAADVTVTNTPGVSAPSIAEHSLALLLAVARHIPRIDAETRQGRWPRGQVSQMSGKTLGVIGLGAIGRRMAKLGEGIGMEVIAWTMHPNPALGFTLVPLEELYAASDAVSVHLRLSPDTKGFIGAAQLAMMKPGAILINTARGPIVDEAALLEALASGRLSGAGLDVFDVEPLPAESPLWNDPRILISPHISGPTTPMGALDGFLACLDAIERGEQPNTVVDRDRQY